MYYHILETLTPCSREACLQGDVPYVAVLTSEQWQDQKEAFRVTIDMDFDMDTITTTKVLVNADALTGSFKQPISSPPYDVEGNFAFVLNEFGIILIEQGHYVQDKVQHIQKTKHWKLPSLERFIYDFLESLIALDLDFLESIDWRFNDMEEGLIHGLEGAFDLGKLNGHRRDLLALNSHYEHLADLTQEFYENENNFFKDSNLRYFRNFSSRLNFLQKKVNHLRDSSVQIRDLNKSQLDMRQGKIIAILTIVTSCCLPLNLLVGWYGMNFKYMPKLSASWGYPTVILFAISIFTTAILFFKYKKWL